MRNTLRTIKHTLATYDPDNQTVVVGSAALALQGIKVPGGVPDVDTLSTPDYVRELHVRMGDDMFDRTTQYGNRDGKQDRICLEPRTGTNAIANLLPYQSFTAVIDERYDIDFFLAYARSVMVGDYRCVPAHEILLWKATIGRKKDLDKVEKILAWRGIRKFLSSENIDEIRAVAKKSRVILEAERPAQSCDCPSCNMNHPYLGFGPCMKPKKPVYDHYGSPVNTVVGSIYA